MIDKKNYNNFYEKQERITGQDKSNPIFLMNRGDDNNYNNYNDNIRNKLFIGYKQNGKDKMNTNNKIFKQKLIKERDEFTNRKILGSSVHFKPTNKQINNNKKKKITSNKNNFIKGFRPSEYPKCDRLKSVNSKQTPYFNEILDYNNNFSDEAMKELENNYDFLNYNKEFHPINNINEDKDKYNKVI